MAPYLGDPTGGIDTRRVAGRAGAAGRPAGRLPPLPGTRPVRRCLGGCCGLVDPRRLAGLGGGKGRARRFRPLRASVAGDGPEPSGAHRPAAYELRRLSVIRRALVPARPVPAGRWRRAAGGPHYRGCQPRLVSARPRWCAAFPRHLGTPPDATRDDAYSWCKAPRLEGEVAEVGALSRQLVAGHPLPRDLVARDGATVEARVVARLLEVALVTMAMERWLRAIDPAAPFIDHTPLPAAGEGAGLTEAARGSLGHWVNIQGGRIANYQIIAPTTWNFSPRDAAGTPGPLEQALRGAPVREGESEPVAVQHIVRSFDPCMVCTVH
ncbi:nickel-dependent hydrogenase large subunit [Nitrospirillum sp. BR 11752]|uniref:nickel-dependent hydrogenase large subunit n=1 Tax=Nitrospirillum sp. BR 11752 TaxID=3104293 RepID=UPI002EC4EF50|nr:nickel-dependent hydrogenase large subunit [Nitrospirillum sp. BR 11752]